MEIDNWNDWPVIELSELEWAYVKLWSSGKMKFEMIKMEDKDELE